MSSRRPPKAFVKDLRTFDQNLRCTWDETYGLLPPPLARRRRESHGKVNRWRIEIWNQRTQCHEHVMWIWDEKDNFAYREPGPDILEKLYECDSQRYGVGGAAWEARGRRQLMNQLGLKEDETDPMLEGLDAALEHRYYAGAQSFADKILRILKKDHSFTRATGAAEKRIRLQADHIVEANEAREREEGRIILDPDLGVARVDR